MITECEDCKCGSLFRCGSPLEEDLGWVRGGCAQTLRTDAAADGGRKLRQEVPGCTFRRRTRAAYFPTNRMSCMNLRIAFGELVEYCHRTTPTVNSALGFVASPLWISRTSAPKTCSSPRPIEKHFSAFLSVATKPGNS